MRQLTESRQRLVDLRAVREEEVRQLHSLLARQVRAERALRTAAGACEGAGARASPRASSSAHALFRPGCRHTLGVTQLPPAACADPAQVVEAIAEVEARQQRLLQRQEQLLQLCRQLAAGQAAGAGPAEGGGSGQPQEAAAGPCAAAARAEPCNTESTAAAADEAAGDANAPGSAAAAAAAVAAVRRRQLAASLAAAKGA